MATFIPGITDTPSQRLSFKPDWNRVERGLMLRGAAYAEGARKVKSLYESMFQSPMLRDENIERRDTYLKEISERLKEVSALDLSIPQNQENALKLFEPLNNDKMIVKDILWTKNYIKELDKAEQMRNSSNPEVRRQYWETGVQALNYRAAEFKNADSESALNMSTAKYVGNVDFMSLANKMYKEMGISVTQDVVTGGYIWTKKNGDIAVPLTKSMVNNLFSNDPAVKDMLKTQAYVQRKQYVEANADRLGSAEAAEQDYATKVLMTISADHNDQVVSDSEDVKDLRAKVDAWDKIITSRGIIPGSDEHKKYLETIESLKEAEAAADNTRNSVPNTATLQMGNLKDAVEAADNTVVFSNFSSISDNIAKLLAYKDVSMTAKTDPIYMAKLNSQLALNRSMVMENIRQINRIAMLDEKQKRGIGTGTSASEKKDQKKQEDLDLAKSLLFGTGTGISGSSTLGPVVSNKTTDQAIADIINNKK